MRFEGGRTLLVLGSESLADCGRAKELLAPAAKGYLTGCGRVITVRGEQGPAAWAADFCRRAGIPHTEVSSFMAGLDAADQALFYLDTRDETGWRRVHLGIAIHTPLIGYRWSWNDERWHLVMT